MSLTNLYGANYKKSLVTEPFQKVHQGEWGGKELTLVETFTLDADAADQQSVKVGRLPPGAMVLGARIYGPDLGATGTLQLGNSVSINGKATDAAVANSFIKAADSSGQVFDVADGAAAQRGAAIGVRFASSVDVTLLFNGATSGATGLIITVIVKYIVD